MGQGDLEGSLDRLDLLGVPEIRRPAAGPRLDEGGDAQGGAGQEAAQDGLAPIESRLLKFPGVAVGAQRVVGDEVQLVPQEIKDLLVPKPQGGLAVDLQRRRLEEERRGQIRGK
jgi:hypothetical protein